MTANTHPRICFHNALCHLANSPWYLLAGLYAGIGATAVWPMNAAELRSGLARIDITPNQPVQLAGYASRKDLSQGIHDPLGARAIAFEQDGHRLVLVSIDNLGFYAGTAEPLRQSILDACALQPAELFLCAIHTHSAPSLTLDPEKGHTNNVTYTRQLQAKLMKVVQAALDGLQPVRLGFGAGASPVGVNRRELVRQKDGSTRIVLGRNTSVLMDREVQVLKLVRPEGDQLIGAVFGYATHSTSLGPANYLVSGDIHGLAEQFLENFLGPKTVTAGFAGASGNLDPWVRVLPEFRTTNGWIPEPVLMGTMLGEEVARVLEHIQPLTNNAVIATAFKTLALPGKARGATEPASAAPASPFNVSVAQLGELAFVGWGGEVFNEFGTAVKRGSPYAHTFIFTHCNGAAGYVPTRESYPEGGYEVQTSGFAPGAGEALVQETLHLLQQLKVAPSK